MSQSLLYHAFGVRQGYEYWRTEYGEGCVRFFLLVKAELLVCPECGSRGVSRKGRRFRDLQTVPIGLKPEPTLNEMKAFLKEWCQWAIDTGIRQMQQLAKTLTLHARGIFGLHDAKLQLLG